MRLSLSNPLGFPPTMLAFSKKEMMSIGSVSNWMVHLLRMRVQFNSSLRPLTAIQHQCRCRCCSVTLHRTLMQQHHNPSRLEAIFPSKFPLRISMVWTMCRVHYQFLMTTVPLFGQRNSALWKHLMQMASIKCAGQFLET